MEEGEALLFVIVPVNVAAFSLFRRSTSSRAFFADSATVSISFAVEAAVLPAPVNPQM